STGSATRIAGHRATGSRNRATRRPPIRCPDQLRRRTHDRASVGLSGWPAWVVALYRHVRRFCGDDRRASVIVATESADAAGLQPGTDLHLRLSGGPRRLAEPVVDRGFAAGD